MKPSSPLLALLANLSSTAPELPAAAARFTDRTVSPRQASQIALRPVQRRTGRRAFVGGISREDDFGARWEVEVPLNHGGEFDVYENSRSRIVGIIRKRPERFR